MAGFQISDAMMLDWHMIRNDSIRKNEFNDESYKGMLLFELSKSDKRKLAPCFLKKILWEK